MTPLGDAIRDLRTRAGLSQRELADRVGVTAPSLSKIETGKEIPSRALILAIAAELEADHDELLALAERPPEEVEALLVRSAGARAFYREAIRAKLSEPEWQRMRVAMQRIAGSKRLGG